MSNKGMESKNPEQEKERIIETEKGSFRKFSGLLGLLQRIILCLIPIIGVLFILNVHMSLGWYIYREQYIGLFMALIFISVFLSTPATRQAPRNYLPWYDLFLILIGLVVGLYLMWYYPEISKSQGELYLDRAVLGIIAMLLILEAVRRFAGWVLFSVISIFIFYGFFANQFPGILQGLPTSWKKLSIYIYLDPNSMLNLLHISAGIVVAFIFFGQILLAFGGGKHLTDIALLGFGRLRGGAAKTAVVASSLLGTMSGGAISNTLISGSVTIPLMIRTGYSPEIAGAVESVASSGGNLMPPIMGVVAFLIAENLGVPYADIAIAAIIPAVLFYMICFIQLDLQAGKDGLRGLLKSEVPKAREVMREAWVVIPCIGILVYLLMILRLAPARAGIFSAFAAVPLLLMAKGSRKSFLHRILKVLEGSGQMLVNISAIIAGAGIIVGIANASGFGFNITYALTTIGGNNKMLLLILSALACTILGMGMPSVPAYALVATLVAPALVELGVVPLAAHLFILYYSMVSNWTPPVALACFAASTISGASANRTGLIAMRLGIMAYLLPFLFVYSPALILKSESWIIILASVLTAVAGTTLLGVGLAGYLFQVVPMARRVLFCIAGVALLIPFQESITINGLLINGIGLVLAVLLFLWEFRCRHPKSARVANEEM